MFALSRFSISCSKLSNATILSETVTSGSEVVIADMEETIRSASEGPPKRAASASGLSVLWGGGAVGSAAVEEEFSTLHFRRVDMLGSIAVVVFVCRLWECGGVVWIFEVVDGGVLFALEFS